MLHIDVKDPFIFARISRGRIVDHLSSLSDWGILYDLENITVWACFSKDANSWDIFTIPVEDIPNWGIMCKKGVEALARTGAMTVLDYLVLFDAVQLSDLFACVDPSIDDVFKDLMKPQGAITEGFEALRKAMIG